MAGFAESDRGGKIPRPEGHPYLRMTRVLEPGMVVTIEPGLYFIDMLLDEVKKAGNAASIDWSRVDTFRPYGGIRIEDEAVSYTHLDVYKRQAYARCAFQPAQAAIGPGFRGAGPVSYTHLDVYKRQAGHCGRTRVPS